MHNLARPLTAAMLCIGAAFPAWSSPSCPPSGYDLRTLRDIKQKNFEISDERARNALALALVPCLAHPDPELRDAIAFEALSHFLRQKQLSDATRLALEADLEARLKARDPAGFERPFAALALSEVARADRLNPFLPADTRARLFAAAIDFFTGVRDYRGFDDREGWRHGIAHGADLLLQLSLNPAFAKPEMDRILAAIETQISPPDHFYIYGEPIRLARPVISIAGRNLYSLEEWTAWMKRVSSPSPLTGWGDAFSSQAGLARRNNVLGFISRVYIVARVTADKASPTTADKATALILPGALDALNTIP